MESQESLGILVNKDPQDLRVVLVVQADAVRRVSLGPMALVFLA